MNSAIIFRLVQSSFREHILIQPGAVPVTLQTVCSLQLRTQYRKFHDIYTSLITLHAFAACPTCYQGLWGAKVDCKP